MSKLPVKSKKPMLALMSSVILISGALSGCATTTLSQKIHKTYDKEVKTELVNDTVIAFGTPTQASAYISSNNVVIVGNKHSYVLTQGGTTLVQLLGKLNPKNISITKKLEFKSNQKKGEFSGILPLTYVQLEEDITKDIRKLVVQNNAKECTTRSDRKLQARRFCFNIPMQGLIYPAVRNLDNIQKNYKALSKPYQISIYTSSYETIYKNKNPTADILLFPFAAAFDIVTLPAQMLSHIFDD